MRKFEVISPRIKTLGDLRNMSSAEEIEFIKDMVKGFRAQIPKLKLLVFGPGEKNPDDYARKCFKKRLEVRNLLSLSHKVIFPEEAYAEALQQGTEGLTVTLFERYLIENTDYSIFISCPNCPGAEHEISAFTTVPEFIKKIIFYFANDRKFESTWVLEDWLRILRAGGGRIGTFCEKELDECYVKKKIVDEIQNIATFCSIYPYKKYGGADSAN